MSKKLRRKIFFSWATGAICWALAQEIVGKSLKFSVLLGIIIASAFTVYFLACHYELIKLIKEEVESWFE